LLAVLLTGLLAIVAGQLVRIQVIDGPRYAAEATEQRTREITLPARRGGVFDRQGEPLAVTLDARSVYANPRVVADRASVATALERVLGGDAKTYEAKLAKDASFVYLARKVDPDVADAVASLGVTGVDSHEDWRRVYPSNELACQSLGFVGVDDEGLAGLELRYDDVLSGAPGQLVAERDEAGHTIPGGVVYREEPVDGHNIVLTIDKDIQYQAQVALSEAVKKWGAKSGSVVVMDPRNGEILAMASVPTFNPNRYSTGSDAAYRNRPIVDTYEPGSTIKSLTAAAVLEAGLYTSESIFDIPPTIKVGTRTIGEAHPRPRVQWPLADIVTHSSNVGSVLLGQALGEDGLYEYFSRFGLTDKTGVDFPGEAKGWLPPPAQWSASSLPTISFGQGVSMTPLQLARALSAIANGGELVTPHFLYEVPDDSAVALDWPKRRVISETTSETMREILSDVVRKGTGTQAAVAGYQVAGKTGTAQKARTDGRPGYADGKYVASFSGFIPAEDPAVLIIVSVDEPSNSIYGGVVAAPAFSKIAAFCMEHLKIPPGAAPGVGDDM
jgi:cell division protein FtsI (penicillin-binding protein 3)